MGNDGAMRRLVLGGLAVAVFLAGCGGDVDPARTPAGIAQVRLLDEIYNGRYARAYADLHPAYQRLVPKERFVSCSRQLSLGGLDSIEILDVYDESVSVPGERKVKAKAVRVRLTSSNGETTEPFVRHEVKVGPRWRWVLNEPALRAYRAGKCPSA